VQLKCHFVLFVCSVCQEMSKSGSLSKSEATRIRLELEAARFKESERQKELRDEYAQQTKQEHLALTSAHGAEEFNHAKQVAAAHKAEEEKKINELKAHQQLEMELAAKRRQEKLDDTKTGASLEVLKSKEIAQHHRRDSDKSSSGSKSGSLTKLEQKLVERKIHKEDEVLPPEPRD